MRRLRSVSVLLAIAGCQPAIVVGGRAGDGGSDDASTPCAMPLVASGIALGDEHACVITDGIVRCWGSGVAGQLCAGTTVSGATTPTPVYGVDTYASVSAGGLLTCMRHEDDSLVCCGTNFGGGLADGTDVSSAYPVAMIPDVVALAIGFDNVYASRPANLLTVWGDDTHGQLGLGPGPVGDAVRTETDVAGVTFTVVDAAPNHACALDPDAHLFCAGSNVNSELGMPGPARDVFTSVSASLEFASIGAGYSNSCGVTTGGALYCWGSNDPELSPTTSGAMVFPTRIGTATDFAEVDMGFDHGCVLRTDHRLFCFGDNSHGELGRAGQGGAELVEIDGGGTFRHVVTGRDLTCAIRESDSAVVCFGKDEFVALGHAGRGPAPFCLDP